ncbi:MAG: polysaccharide biosynthesis/export family protein [Phycisphaerales bacterium]|nr:polysaccharide biosynthesis/export family protein [Phycisphaerales bacterium]
MSHRAGRRRPEKRWVVGRGPRTVATAGLSLCAALAAALSGCGTETDSWLWDPSVVGRWENTPTVVPILERIDVIEREEGDFVEITQVTPDDLVPVISDYTVGPGDGMRVEIYDFIAIGQPAIYDRVVDTQGTLDLPQLGRIPVQGLTAEEIRQLIGQEVVRAGLMREPPLVAVTMSGQRQATFSIFGSIAGVGRYFIPSPDYRLLEALTEAGGISPTIRKVQVIRQVPLTEAAGARRPADSPTAPRPAPTPQGTNLEDLLRRLGEDPSPGSLGGDEPVGWGALSQNQSSQPVPVDPPIDLIESAPTQPTRTEPARTPGQGSWMFLNGRWVQVTAATSPSGGTPEADSPRLVTQRIIEVPTGPLLKGAAQYNIVIRPGDVISVPGPDLGLVYMGGPGIARPGVYQMPQVGRLTLKQAIISAGGLSAVGIPERVDLTRRIGDDREATIRLNLRAIFEGTQPDVFLKPDDQVNVGTHFWAQPAAIIRNGFRTTYGFGFLLDRNFGNDVFGAPPTNRFGQ